MKIDVSIVQRIQNSIDFIEENLLSDISLEQISGTAFLSISAYYKIFSRLFDTTLKDYIRKRRLCHGAYLLIHSEFSVLDIAMEVGFQSSEAFSRAFKKLFFMSPSEYRQRQNYVEAFPKIELLIRSEKTMNIEKVMNRIEVTKRLESSKPGYLLDIDIDGFAKINDLYGYAVGDVTLLYVSHAINQVLSENNLKEEVIRIGGDEFIVILDTDSKESVSQLAEQIIYQVASCPISSEHPISVSVSIGIVAFETGENQSSIEKCQSAMLSAKRDGRNCYRFEE